ncbi:30S ribosomal protein S16 [Candidatus Dependentiae bacterium]|nr:30S ribosomal protein S16 [Candidatus Dependentiae bacterium]
MPVRIRLSRIGKKKVPFYRIIAVDGRKKRDGKFLQDLGTYDALNSRLIQFDQEGVDKWISVGAQPSESALKIIKRFKRDGIASGPVRKAIVEQPQLVAEENIEKADKQ